jgi:hypothetical protein
METNLPLSVCVLVDGVMVEPEEIPVIAYSAGDAALIETNVGELNSLVRSIGGLSSHVDLSILIDSPGGLDKARLPISEAMRRVNGMGGSVWAFNQERAESNAGWLFCEASSRVAIVASEVMLHQAFFVKRTTQCDPVLGHRTRLVRENLLLAAHPNLFRTRLLEWLSSISNPEARLKAFAKAREAFESSSPLDDFWMTAEELDEWGMMHAIVDDEAALFHEFLSASSFQEDMLPPSVRNFFGF